MTKTFPLILACALLGGCTRPEQVRNVASASDPILAGIQRSSASLHRQFLWQRENLAFSAARYDRLRREMEMRVVGAEAEWADTGKKARTERFARLREQDAKLLSDPLAPLQTVTIAVSPPPPLELKDLIAAAKTLDRLQGREGLTQAELLSFVVEVNTELGKLEQEQASAASAASNEPQ